MSKSTGDYRIDERNYDEKLLLDQLTGKVCVDPLLTEPQEAGV
jgi:hypothetical protein